LPSATSAHAPVARVLPIRQAAVWLFQHRDLGRAERDAKAGVDSAVRGTKQAIEKLDVRLDAHEIAEELKQTGRVVRRKAAVVAHEVAAVRIEAPSATASSTKSRVPRGRPRA
jgi:hypothetical protein